MLFRSHAKEHGETSATETAINSGLNARKMFLSYFFAQHDDELDIRFLGKRRIVVSVCKSLSM